MYFITYCKSPTCLGSTYDINSLLYILLVFFETPWWWLREQPKHVRD